VTVQEAEIGEEIKEKSGLKRQDTERGKTRMKEISYSVRQTVAHSLFCGSNYHSHLLYL